MRSKDESAGDLGEGLLYQHFLDEEEARRITSRTKSDPVDTFVRKHVLACCAVWMQHASRAIACAQRNFSCCIGAKLLSRHVHARAHTHTHTHTRARARAHNLLNSVSSLRHVAFTDHPVVEARRFVISFRQNHRTRLLHRTTGPPRCRRGRSVEWSRCGSKATLALRMTGSMFQTLKCSGYVVTWFVYRAAQT